MGQGRIFQHAQGSINLKTAFILTLVILGLYVGFKLTSPWVDYFSLKDAMTQVLRMAKTQVISEGEIKRKILERARELEIPLTEKDIWVERQGGKITIAATYTVRVQLPFGLERPFSFSPEVQSQ